MRPRRLRPALLATLAALLLASGLAPTQATASDEATEGETITTVLHPGWNMVGWVGPETPVAELFDALPQLRRVSAWDAAGRDYLRAFRGDYARLPSLTAGMGLWLHLGGDATVEWTRPVSGEAVLLSLRTGRNLAAWTGEDGAPIAEALGRFGDTFVQSWRWDPEAQQFDHYHPGRIDGNRLAVLQRGDALWIELTAAARWWQAGTAGAEFSFGQGVTAERQAEVRDALGDVMAFFAEQYGIEPPQFLLGSHEGAGCGAVNTFITGVRRVSSYIEVASDVTGPSLERCVAHEYFHVLQAEFGEGKSSPLWIVEGTAEYAEGVYQFLLGRSTSDTIRADWSTRSAWTAVDLSEVEDETFYKILGGHALGALGIDWLAAHSAERSKGVEIPPGGNDRFAEQAMDGAYIRYYRLLPQSDSWQEAFQAAFGISPANFYEAFDDYLDATGTRAPHLSDDVVRPAIAFLGDVPADTRTALEEEMERVRAFLIERLGAEPFEYSVYVAADEQSARSTFDDLVSQRVVGAAWHCSVRGTNLIFHVLTCGGDLPDRMHFNAYFDGLLFGRYNEASPAWLMLAGREYARVSYRVERGLSSYGEVLRRRVRLAQQSPAMLQEITDHAGWDAAGNEVSWALSFLAVDWLAERAGRRALLEYYRLLPRGLPERSGYEPGAGSWQAAFEQAFGLTIEDFYEQFEAYRATLRQ